MRSLFLALSLLLVSVGKLYGQGDDVRFAPALVERLQGLPAGSAFSFCIEQVAIRENVPYIDSLTVARPILPDCESKPVLLIRPWCSVTADELVLGLRAPFVVFVCLDEFGGDRVSVRIRVVRLKPWSGPGQRAV